MLIRSRVAGFSNAVYQSKAGLWFRGLFVPCGQNVCIVRTRDLGNGRHEKTLFLGHNIVTNDGDIYYAQVGAQETPSPLMNRFYVSTVAFSPAPAKATTATDLASVVAGSEKANDAGYPKADDTANTDNTGALVDATTHKVAYTKTDWNDPSVEGITISAAGQTFGSGGGALLMAHNESPAINKTANDTLDIYVNHRMNGV